VTSAKLGPEAKLLIESRPAGAEDRVDVLLRLREELTPETRSRLGRRVSRCARSRATS
jgi:hypothetical protein